MDRAGGAPPARSIPSLLNQWANNGAAVPSDSIRSVARDGDGSSAPGESFAGSEPAGVPTGIECFDSYTKNTW